MSPKGSKAGRLGGWIAVSDPSDHEGNQQKALFSFTFQQFMQASHSLLTEPEKRNSVRFHEVGQSDREQKNNMKRAGLPALFYFDPTAIIPHPDMRAPP
jgi:hypothetical protein